MQGYKQLLFPFQVYGQCPAVGLSDSEPYLRKRRCGVEANVAMLFMTD